jgi:hypothetical protein
VCYGYFGDHLFALSVAERLLKERQFDAVDYYIGFPQMTPFFERNEYVRKVLYSGVTPYPRPVMDVANYTKVFQIQPTTFRVAPPIEMQLTCGVRHPDANFTLVTNPQLDLEVQELLAPARNTGTPILAIMNSWEEKTFRFTPEQYAAGIDVPQLGYGGAHRDTDRITKALSERFVTTIVGAPKGKAQTDTTYAGQSLDYMASVLKHCDYFIGAEGGVANFAHAAGTKTILTSDFVHQLYGWNGVIRKIPEPQLGPRFYDPTPGRHVDLDPYLTDDEVIEQITQLVTRGNL